MAAREMVEKPKVRRFHFFTQKAGSRVSRSTSGDLGVLIFLLIMGALMAIPLYFSIVQSLKPSDELFMFPPRLYVRNPTSQNYADLFRLMSGSWIPFSRYIFNTVMITGVGTFGHIILASLAAYPLAKYVFPGSKAFSKMVVFSLMFNATVTTIPGYIVMATLGWIDTYWSLIVPAFGMSLGLYLMQSFMYDLPDALFDAAKIDGAPERVIFWKIVMPNVKSAWLTLMIFSVQSLWNINNGMYIYSEPLKTLPYAISQIVSGGIARAGASAAASVIMMIVPIVVFVISQSNVIETMAKSGIKE
ncbi:MAG TPA: carbohydrate ABC transporter permease [Clostridiales bacterium]|nr:carbohydrate ABC transporter permease [Clostridiales bacterium]